MPDSAHPPTPVRWQWGCSARQSGIVRDMIHDIRKKLHAVVHPPLLKQKQVPSNTTAGMMDLECAAAAS